MNERNPAPFGFTPAKKRKFKLEDLVAGITRDNVHGEDEWGPAVGKEIW